MSTYLLGHRWRCGHVAVHSCRVHRETVETVEETCDWALTVTSRWLWTTSARRWCRLFPLHWWRGPSTVDRQVLRTWRPTSPTGTRSALVWRSCVTSRRQSLNKYTARWLMRHAALPDKYSDGEMCSVFTIRYDTIEEFNVDSKAEYSA